MRGPENRLFIPKDMGCALSNPRGLQEFQSGIIDCSFLWRQRVQGKPSCSTGIWGWLSRTALVGLRE